MHDPVWFWLRIVTPLMAGLAAALAARGVEVTLVAEQEMSPARTALGWQTPTPGGVRLCFASTAQTVDALVRRAPAGSIHICEGLRGNGLVGRAQQQLARRGLRQWVAMETVNDPGWRGALKRLDYQRRIRFWRNHIEGILAIGYKAPGWYAARGMPTERIFPFAYFLPPTSAGFPVERDASCGERPFRFLFAGQFIERKRLDLLLEALAELQRTDFTLTIIGSGPLESALRARAENLFAGRVKWLGRQPSTSMSGHMANADCLVLPSRFDGWGAVVSEALMAGTPAICSDNCGAAGAVLASGRGGVFRSGDRQSLCRQLGDVMIHGPIANADRKGLAEWAVCLGAEVGADYLADILSGKLGECKLPPWMAEKVNNPT
jgi:glycosyltransferase involved in cell wall biosynthesis